MPNNGKFTLFTSLYRVRIKMEPAVFVNNFNKFKRTNTIFGL